MKELPLWLVVLVLVAAFVLAVLVGPRARRWFDSEGEDGSNASDFGGITAPLIALTTLTLSFTLVNVWGSFHEASVTANGEALAVDYQSDMAQQLTDVKTRQEIEASLVCYSRAIAGAEWQVMKQRGEATADEVDPWSDRLQAQIGQIANAPGGPGVVAREMLRADKERGEARSKRLATARPSIPVPVMLLLLCVAAAAIVTLGLAHLPIQRRWVHVVGLALVAASFLALFAVITELDSPFHGLISIQSTDMTRVATSEAVDFAEAYPGVALPCDESGRIL